MTVGYAGVSRKSPVRALKIVVLPEFASPVIAIFTILSFQSGSIIPYNIEGAIMQDGDEILEVVDPLGNVIGSARRKVMHGNPALLHRVVHVLVINREGCLLLQKRSLSKDVAAGKWDTSVGGHVNPGETSIGAALREMKEELDLDVSSLVFLYDYIYSNDIESELVSTFLHLHDGNLSEINFNRGEIDEIRFWELKEISERLGSGIFSGQFEQEFKRYKQKEKAEAEE